MTTTGPTTIEELNSPSDVLAFARVRRADADRAETDVLTAAVIWAEQHPPESIDDAATWITGGGDTGLPVAGPGAPLVAEFCIAEFAAAIGRTTDSGKAFIADALELKYRLSRHWGRVQSGDLPVWKARRIAQATQGLSMQAVSFVDAQLAAFAHKIGLAALERLVEEAVNRFMPEQAQENAEKAADGRHVKFHHDQVSFNGTTYIEGELDLADALDLDAALTRGAESLAAGGCTETHDVRRSIAAGELARRQLALDLAAADEGSTPTRRAKPTKPRQVVLYVHLSEAAITSGSCSGGIDLARVENHRQVVTAEQVRTWCANPDTQVIVKPVIDLNEHIGVEGYEVPDRLEEQTQLRDHTCVFPGAPCQHEDATTSTASPMPRAAPPVPATSPRSVDDITASRPIRPGATPSWNPGRSCGRVPTATSSSATTKAPSTSPLNGHHHARANRRTSEHPLCWHDQCGFEPFETLAPQEPTLAGAPSSATGRLRCGSAGSLTRGVLHVPASGSTPQIPSCRT